MTPITGAQKSEYLVQDELETAPLADSSWRSNLGRTQMDLSVPRGQDWWTGKAPVHNVCPGVDEQGVIHSLPIPNLTNPGRQELLDYFDNSWTLSEVVFASLVGEEGFFRPPYHGLRHPMVFYYLHPAVLYVNKLRVAGILPGPIDDYYESLFETGVDEMSWDDMSKNSISWPSIDGLHDYRKIVYKTVRDVILNHPDLDAVDGKVKSIGLDSPLWALVMGFEHERIHIETSTVLIRELPAHLVMAPPQWPELALVDAAVAMPPQVEREMMGQEGGKVSYGKPESVHTFGWDNEYGERSVDVLPFSVSKTLISNAEFYRFVQDSGYQRRELWTEEGWAWRSYRNTKAPTFWLPAGPAGSHQYQLRTTFEIVPMQWSWPCVVNYHEAAAYCKWLGDDYRLMSECEHQFLRTQLPAQSIDGTTGSIGGDFNLHLTHGGETPVDAQSESGYPVCDLFGNVWQWLEDDFNPLTNFKIHRFYDDFSTPCFDGKHCMIMGGSFISTGDEATVYARFHFRPHFFQQAGFRVVLAKGESKTKKGKAFKIDRRQNDNVYEQQSILNEYLTLHYAPSEIQMPHAFMAPVASSLTHFPQRCADVVTDWSNQLGIAQGRALDVGCAVGGSAFRLADTFRQVEAVDLSQQFIDAAKKIQESGSLRFDAKLEGEITETVNVSVDPVIAKKINFRRADACSLPPEYEGYDAVLLANLLCRLTNPMSCLSRMSGGRGIVKPGGLLVITTPFTWSEQFTPRDLWLGGYKDTDGNAHMSRDGLIAALSGEFDLKHSFDMPLVIREHYRKYQLITTLCTVWQRKK